MYEAIPDALIEKYVKDFREYLALPDDEKIAKEPLTYIILTKDDKSTPQLQTVISKAVHAEHVGATQIYTMGDQSTP